MAELKERVAAIRAACERSDPRAIDATITHQVTRGLCSACMKIRTTSVALSVAIVSPAATWPTGGKGTNETATVSTVSVSKITTAA